MPIALTPDADRDPMPAWVPSPARAYLAHVVDGVPIRALARAAGCHASTVMRQVRRCEQRRDDPLVDHALRRLGGRASGAPSRPDQMGTTEMTMTMTRESDAPSGETMDREARRILQRLTEPGACLAVAQGMEKAVVVREAADGQTIRIGVVDRTVAEAMALNAWIATTGTGRIARYRLTGAGRAVLRDMVDGDAGDDAERAANQAGAPAGPGRIRYTMTETPLLALSRRRDKSGAPFLSPALVTAGERLREEFELARMTTAATPDWNACLETPAGAQGAAPVDGRATGPGAAAARVRAALAHLGPGLGDVVLRACCYLEGMETIEERMGWAARSGKIVLRIGLERLHRHYQAAGRDYGSMIG